MLDAVFGVADGENDTAVLDAAENAAQRLLAIDRCKQLCLDLLACKRLDVLFGAQHALNAGR